MTPLVLAEIIGLAIVVAANPVPVISLLSLVVRPEGIHMAMSFAAGWAGAVLLSLTLLTFGTTALFPSTSALMERHTTGVVLPLIIGIALVVLGLAFVRRPPPAADAPPSRISRLFSTLTPSRAVLVGAGLAVVKPKTLVALVAASTVIGAEGTGPTQTLILLAVFTAVGSATVITPIVLRATGGPKMVNGLQRTQQQISRYFSRALGALLLIIGIVLAASSMVTSLTA